MEFTSFMTGVISSAIFFALFIDKENRTDDDFEEDNDDGEFTGRYVTLSCQTCRKLKKHLEVEPSLYQCTKCKRHVDLR